MVVLALEGFTTTLAFGGAVVTAASLGQPLAAAKLMVGVELGGLVLPPAPPVPPPLLPQAASRNATARISENIKRNDCRGSLYTLRTVLAPCSSNDWPIMNATPFIIKTLHLEKKFPICYERKLLFRSSSQHQE